MSNYPDGMNWSAYELAYGGSDDDTVSSDDIDELAEKFAAIANRWFTRKVRKQWGVKLSERHKTALLQAFDGFFAEELREVARGHGFLAEPLS